MNLDDKVFVLDEVDEYVEGIISDECRKSFEWEWVDNTPKVSPYPTEPPEDAWMTIGGVEWATNGVMVVRRDCPVRPCCTKAWVTNNAFEPVRHAISQHSPKMPRHTGFFDDRIANPYRAVGADIFGLNNNTPGYAVLNGELIGIVMPMHGQRS